MKLFQSKGIVAILAALALLLVGKNLIWPFIGPMFARRAPAKTQATAQNKTAPAPVKPPTSGPVTSARLAVENVARAVLPSSAQNAAGKLVPALAPQFPMNREDLSARSPNWASSPLRDPFRKLSAANGKSAREQLTLTGILKQTESDLAVLNNRVLAAGETILGFRVETVEGDRVWVSGPNGREVLEFKYYAQAPPQPAAETNAAPKEPSAQASASAPPGGI